MPREALNLEVEFPAGRSSQRRLANRQCHRSRSRFVSAVVIAGVARR
jgi:hypothetical protein